MKEKKIPAGLRRLFIAACVAWLAAGSGAHAADWPTKPLRIVVPSAPGGGTDLMARALGQKLAEVFKVAVIIDNKPGGDEVIGADFVAKAAPDGHTILFAAANVAVNPAIRKTMPYAVKDLRPVAITTRLPYVILVNPKLPVQTVAELVSYSQKQPNGLNLANGGTSNLLAAESFRMATGARMTTIQYKGCAPSVLAVLTGETDVTFCSAPAAAQSVLAGKLTALAVTGDSRLAVLPNVPTTRELGDAKYRIDLVQWHGVWVPAGTPGEVVTRLNTEVNRALAMPDINEKARQIGGVIARMSVDEASKFFDEELAVSRRIVVDGKITHEN